MYYDDLSLELEEIKDQCMSHESFVLSIKSTVIQPIIAKG